MGMRQERVPIGADGTPGSVPAAGRRRFRLGMLIICGAALVARVLMLVEAWRTNPLAVVPFEDARVYWDWSAMVATGRMLGTTPFQSAPLYPFLLGLIRALGGGLLTVYVVQTAIHLCTAVLVGTIGYRRFGAGTGLVATALFLLLTEPAFFSGRVLNSTLQLFLVAALLLQLIESHERGGVRAWLAAGALAGLNCLANPAMLPLLVLLGPWAYWRGTPGRPGVIRAAGAVVLAAAVVAPATLHNYLASHEFIPVSAQAGVTFYQGNAPGANGTFTEVAGVSGDRATQNLTALRSYREDTGGEGSWNGVNRYYFRKGLAFWAADPLRGLRLLGTKLYWFLTGRNYGDIYIPALEREAGLARGLTLAPLPTAWVTWPALLAIAFMLRGWRRYLPELVLLAIPLATVCLFWYSPRYRLPALPVIVVAAAWALCRATDFRRHRAWAVAAAISVLAAVLLGPINRSIGFDDVASCRPLFQQSLANAYVETGQLDQAREHFEKALERNPDYIPARFGLADLLRKSGRMDEAIEYLQQALRAAPDNAGLCDGLSVSLCERGRLDEAEELSRRAVRLSPDQPEFHVNLAIVLARKGETEEAIEHFHRALEANPMLTNAYLNLGQLYANMGRLDDALRCCATAVKLDPGLARAHGLAGMILLDRGQYDLGIDALERACDADPANAVYPAALAWHLAVRPDASQESTAQALRLALTADRLTRGNDVHVLDTLAIAYAASGRFGEAVKTLRSAIDLAERAGSHDIVPELRERLALYEAGKPFKKGEPPPRVP